MGDDATVVNSTQNIIRAINALTLELRQVREALQMLVKNTTPPNPRA